MTTLLTIWVAGMPFALIWLLWSLHDAPRDVWVEVGSWEGIAAALLFALVWPFVALSVLWAWVRGGTA